MAIPARRLGNEATATRHAADGEIWDTTSTVRFVYCPSCGGKRTQKLVWNGADGALLETYRTKKVGCPPDSQGRNAVATGRRIRRDVRS